MSDTELNLEKDLTSIRKKFPVLQQCTYLISNSLGAVPRQARVYLEQFYSLWAQKGVKAWEEEWWDLSRGVADQLALFIGAGTDEVTMMPNATIAHWMALSTKFSTKGERRKIVMTDQDFPSSLYAVEEISNFMDWEIVIVRSKGRWGIDVEDILKEIDDRTLFVVTSHVYFKTAFIQDIARISARAREKSALTVIDGYHAPGIIPIDVKKMDVDFYIGGCLKWLCGGPGNAFMYVRPELASALKPHLTGWFAHREPFAFNEEMEYTQDSYRFMSGTPPIPCLYAALAGLEIIRKIGIPQIRQKSLVLTQRIIDKAKARGFGVFTPDAESQRGGAVSLSLPHAYPVKQALGEKEIKVDFRKGIGDEPDVIRVGPHFYNTEEEIVYFFNGVDAIYSSGAYKRYPKKMKRIT